MSIRHWPPGERPREKLLERGAHALSDAELVALLLGAGTRGCSALELARGLLTDFGSLRDLLSAQASRCLARKGMGPARYAILQAAVELARRHFRETLRLGPALAAPETTRTFLLAQLRDRPYEVFCCLYLDNRHRLIAFEELFRGTIDRAGVHPREVLRQTLAHNAAAVMFAHNHPYVALRLSPPGPWVPDSGGGEADERLGAAAPGAARASRRRPDRRARDPHSRAAAG